MRAPGSGPALTDNRSTVQYRIFNRAKDYRPRIPEVAQLFSIVFGRVFPADGWSQWYLNNPYGDPHVVLGYHADQLVGHHALIPQKLVGAAAGLCDTSCR